MTEKKPNQPNQTYEQINQTSKTSRIIFFFCELSLYDEFQPPRLCLSCISMVEDEKRKEKKNQQF